MHLYEFRWRFHWSLLLMFELTTFQQWLGAYQATSHYLNQWWLVLLTHICITRPQWLNNQPKLLCTVSCLRMASQSIKLSSGMLSGGIYCHIGRLVCIYDTGIFVVKCCDFCLTQWHSPSLQKKISPFYTISRIVLSVYMVWNVSASFTFCKTLHGH